MLNERELLIASYAIDLVASENLRFSKEGETFFSHEEASALCGKIHNMLRVIRKLPPSGADA